MAGAQNSHNIIAMNAALALGAQLRGKKCRPFNSDTKIRLRMSSETRFYYPDVSVVCHQNPLTDSFQDEPVVIIEVLSDSTRRTEEGEKKEAYLTIPSLSAYVLIDQDTAQAAVWRRAEHGFEQEIHRGIEALIPLPEIDAKLPLAELYEGLPIDAL
jgi:Uma2 family endonuclease